MFATLARLIGGHPAALLRHVALYGSLVHAETEYAAHRLARRIALGVMAVLLLGCGLTLAGVAALMAAAGLPPGDAPAAFWLLPGAALGAAAVLGWLAARTEPVPAYATLREQLALDAGLLMQAAAENSNERAAPGPGQDGARAGTEPATGPTATSAATSA